MGRGGTFPFRRFGLVSAREGVPARGIPAFQPGVVEIVYIPAGDDPAGVCIIGDGRDRLWFTLEAWERVRDRVDYLVGRQYDSPHRARLDLDDGGGV